MHENQIDFNSFANFAKWFQWWNLNLIFLRSKLGLVDVLPRESLRFCPQGVSICVFQYVHCRKIIFHQFYDRKSNWIQIWLIQSFFGRFPKFDTIPAGIWTLNIFLSHLIIALHVQVDVGQFIIGAIKIRGLKAQRSTNMERRCCLLWNCYSNSAAWSLKSDKVAWVNNATKTKQKKTN